MKLALAPSAEQAQWKLHAACAGPDANDWFPLRRGSDPEPADRAKHICRTACPVRVACFAEAITTPADHDKHGIRAGLSPAERNAIRRRREARAPLGPVETLWCDAQDLYGRRADRLHRPSALTCDIITALAGGALYGSAIARAIGRTQPVVVRPLRKLERLGFTHIEFEYQSPGGGRPAEYWRLTDEGQTLAAALRAEASAVAA